MTRMHRRPQVSRFCFVLALIALSALPGWAQYDGGPGHSIGTVTVRGRLIVLTLNPDALGQANLFNLSHHTVRFTPDGGGYRVENIPFVWDNDFGAPLNDSHVQLSRFAFPFSGQDWNSFSVGMTGSIVFGNSAPPEGERGRRSVPVGRDGGLAVERFAELREAAPEFVNTVPAISVFFKPRMTGERYWKELDDRAVVTWDLTEPYGGIQDWTWTPTVNRFQAVLHKDGIIDLSYDDVAARDAVVGVYPLIAGGSEKEITAISVPGNPSAAPNLDIRQIRLSGVDNLYLRVALEARGPMLAGTDPAIAGITYRICLSRTAPQGPCTEDT
ncbi:MAG TPA: hypothetical protein VMD25_01620, partial [Acidobacteriaceae bacterium]|nr:hypothetical protein [Acidobacteriaceae bacterium]